MSRWNAADLHDRAQILTEGRNPRSLEMHRWDVATCVQGFIDENVTVQAAFAAAGPAITAFVSDVLPGFARGGRLVYLGAGTSGRLGVLDASEAPPTFNVGSDRIIGIIAGGDGALRKSSEGKEDDPEGAIPALQALALGPDDAVLAIAAGGTTPYCHGALAWAKTLAGPPITGFLSCAPIPRPAACDHLIIAAPGPELLTGSTRLKAGTVTKLVLNTISTTLMVQIGKCYSNLMVDVRATNVKLVDRAARFVSQATGLDRPAALAVLEAADGSVKTAVVMHHRGCDRATAEALLVAADGHLGRVVDP